MDPKKTKVFDKSVRLSGLGTTRSAIPPPSPSR